METLKDYLDAGYTYGDRTLERGYVSRKSDIMQLPVEVAGARRYNQVYVRLPNWDSSQYVIRQYLVEPGEV